MNKDEILKKSRQENENKPDERELAAFGTAARSGMMVGGILCVVLAMVCRLTGSAPEIGLTAWLVYFTMMSANSTTLYAKLRQRKQLITTLVYLLATVIWGVALVYAMVN